MEVPFKIFTFWGSNDLYPNVLRQAKHRWKKVWTCKQYSCKISVSRENYIINIPLFLLITVYCGVPGFLGGCSAIFWWFFGWFSTKKLAIHIAFYFLFLGKLNLAQTVFVWNTCLFPCVNQSGGKIQTFCFHSVFNRPGVAGAVL